MVSTDTTPSRESNQFAAKQIIKYSLDNLVDPAQIGWIYYREGAAVIRAKVIRSPKTRLPFLSLPVAFGWGSSIAIVEYEDNDTWKQRAKAMLKEFRRLVGDDYFENGKTLREKKENLPCLKTE
jgi:hypothetical protein